MSVLSDGDIEHVINTRSLVISPYDPKHLQPASVDLTLGNNFVWMEPSRCPKEWFGAYAPGTRPGELALDPFDPTIENAYKTQVVGPRSQFVIEPGMFVLGSIREWIEIPANIVARLEGKSSLARLGLAIHSTAGFVDPGFRGHLTLEIYNFSHIPVALRPRMIIAQISFMLTHSPAIRPYASRGLNSKYQDSQGPVGSRYALNKQPAQD